ncbi:hypothetical protein SAMN04487820_101103 [Actinopolyspora mzabensis]|uniref:Uncharacterized protein n=1 Tax=Actinopolyspora mzabensis TaxID=995066 RepID=A0A1G8VII3_ACTMZ|nr:hypothetical protein [Actinopolyspora mzabensis]SDJ65734.1 hypothetical protein SAMN04487820_101103 [Actinopolyspora mzabensis]
MSDHDISDDDPERPGRAATGAVVTAALLGACLVMLARSLQLLWQQDTLLDVTTTSSRPGVSDVLLRGFIYCFIAAVVAGYLWFTTRAMWLCGLARPVATALVSLGVAALLVLPTGALLRYALDSSAGWLTELLLFPALSALGYASVVRFELGRHGYSRGPHPTSRTAVFGAEMLGICFVLVVWSVWMYYWFARLAIGMSSAQEPASLIVAIHCVLAVLLLVQGWFLVRMMRVIHPAGPVPMLLLALGGWLVLAVLAGLAQWGLWELWRVRSGYEVHIPLLALLAAASFGLVVRGARRRRAVSEGRA